MTIPLVIIALLSLTTLIGLTLLLVVIFNRKKHPSSKSRSLGEGHGHKITDNQSIEAGLDNSRPAVPALSAKKHTLSLLPCHAAAGLCSEEAPKPPIDRGLSITRYPTWSIWSIQSNLMQCIALLTENTPAFCDYLII